MKSPESIPLPVRKIKIILDTKFSTLAIFDVFLDKIKGVKKDIAVIFDPWSKLCSNLDAIICM